MAPTSGRTGERVIAYIDNIGRVEGRIARIFPTGFAMVIVATEHRRARIATKIANLADKRILPEIIN